MELYFAGKDSLGHVQSANLSDLNGLCIEYSGKFTHFELVADDSITPLLSGGHFRFMVGYMQSQGLPPSEACSNTNVSREDVISHLKGLRFVIESMHETEADLEYDFNILSFGHYFYSCFLYINFIYYVT